MIAMETDFDIELANFFVTTKIGNLEVRPLSCSNLFGFIVAASLMVLLAKRLVAEGPASRDTG